MYLGLKFITSKNLDEKKLALIATKHGFEVDIKRGILTLSDAVRGSSLKLTFYGQDDFSSLAQFSQYDNSKLYKIKLGKEHETILEVTLADGGNKSELIIKLYRVLSKELGEILVEDVEGNLIDIESL